MNPATLTLLIDRVVDEADVPGSAEARSEILDGAARFAERRLMPLATVLDRKGCRLEDGRVHTAPGHAEAWRAYALAGWTGLTVPEAAGGQALSLTTATAVQMLMDAANPAFGILALNVRCAARLLAIHGDVATRALWLPRLVDGSWSATICISEPQAGSDVGRIHTRAAKQIDGSWRVFGEKCWISYGDHDLTDRIGHLVLARPDGEKVTGGTRALTLFLVSDTLEGGVRNGVAATRLEDKLGVRGAPTCSIVFDGAVATQVGPLGRGLPTLFAMIAAMRLGVAAQGAAVAGRAAEIAEAYARERRQGGDPGTPPVPIIIHAEVRRLLLAMQTRAEVARLIALQTAAWLDAADAGDKSAAARTALLLPLAKSLGAEAAFVNADDAIQVLGGVGLVREGKVEQLLRDCRALSIVEGTTAIQGIDLLFRRVLSADGIASLQDLLDNLEPHPALVEAVLDVASYLAGASRRAREAAAVPFLKLLGLACADGLLQRAARRAGPIAGRYAALAAFHGAEAEARAALLVARCTRADLDNAFAALFPDYPADIVLDLAEGSSPQR
ncbi:acyl-CoA dehydrogenase family protein [Paracraurococcus lichenis]|uniref:Acyl-CoA dehydrogenase family protein n=1 Tax=Paracraurococcus lichenis TaxID=3064888 RepID=A0ABT9E9H6_9PROT|nr:acyl-CoA dehydrogenase family protein [Paracraurococcus sp. LOR1-02]MDO9712754.1 acyl-CoA dehydrogenase family protein [Paracraurococcus sp. LOR1-02]